VVAETKPYDYAGSQEKICFEDIVVDLQGKLCILAKGGKLGILEGEKWLRLDDHNLNLPEDSKFMVIDPNGRAWIASDLNGGLRSTSTAHPPILLSGLLNLRYGLTLILGGSFWIVLGLTSIAVTRKHIGTVITSQDEIVRTARQNTRRYIVYGLVVGLLVGMISGFLHDIVLLILTSGLWNQVKYDSF
jgi:hypothetical protein